MAFISPSGRSDFTARAMRSAEVGTSVPALAMLKQCGLIPQLPSSPTPIRVLDNACGAGIVTAQLLEHLQKDDSNDSNNILQIFASDLDTTMIELVSARVQNHGWDEIVRVEKADAHATPFADGTFTHVLMNFGPQLMRDAKQMLVESRRILAPDGVGVLGFTTWVVPGFMKSIKAVFPDFNPAATTPVAGEWRDGEKIKETLEEVGFHDVQTQTLDFEAEDPDVDGYLELITGILMAKFFQVGDNKAKYEAYMRQPGNAKMQWQALIVSARS